MWLVTGIIFIVAGIVMIAATFVVQKAEDKKRIAGFYTTATVLKRKKEPKQDRSKVTFELTMDFKIIQVTDTFEASEAENLPEGRRVLIVYVPETGRVYHNPMRKSRNIQAIMILSGFILLLFGASIGMFQFAH